ncbi:MAG: DEAD/DEAH box helicase family protein, partial [Candidatus Cloacimonetes bacterium]|nr:DEAD/DEAH box helicase family protein [Candidatus Cloacimonadota bacterium]
MDKILKNIASRMSLRAPQLESVETLIKAWELMNNARETDLEAKLNLIKSEFPTVTDFEREFPSLCFALATGVGKTRLMGAFISYLYLAYNKRDFIVIAPNLTVYRKLIEDFTPNTPKYVFTGLSAFSQNQPVIITGDNYEQGIGVREAGGRLEYQADAYEENSEVHINIFNISKINSEVRGGKQPRIKRLAEYIGKSYFEYLADIHDLVMLMDESHHYRASSGMRAINELKPILGLELTATPIMKENSKEVRFKNVIYDYPLANAIKDGFVKNPAVVTRRDFVVNEHTAEELETIKLEDGIKLHEIIKRDLMKYHLETGNRLVKPFVLIIASDTTHSQKLISKIKSDDFFDGRYKSKVIRIDSKLTGDSEDDMITRLLEIEKNHEPTEIVIHVNMLKEGWDVNNLYTIIPLRTASARILIEQSIGRGLRLPFGKRTGVPALDKLSIVAHDKFQEIVDEANREDSIINKIEQVFINDDDFATPMETIVSKPIFAPTEATGNETLPEKVEREVKKLVHEVIKAKSSEISSNELMKPEELSDLKEKVVQALTVEHTKYFENEENNLDEMIKSVADEYIQLSIDIPLITIIPAGEIEVTYRSFTLDCSEVKYPYHPIEFVVQTLQSQEREIVQVINEDKHNRDLAGILVKSLRKYSDIDYQPNAEL